VSAGPATHALVLGAAVLAALAAAQRFTHALPGSSARFEQARERCHGVARAGHNDCGTSQHACAAQALHDRADDEWISLPAGTCARIAGGRPA
jgi:uncharacterized membrane protein